MGAFSLELRRSVGWGVGAGLLAAVLGGCSTDSRQVTTRPACEVPSCLGSGTPEAPGAAVTDVPSGNGNGAAPSNSGASPDGTAVSLEGVAGVSSLAGASACLSVSPEMTLPPSALYLMLDSSGSMEEPVGGGAGSKWAAIQRAVRGFLAETQGSDLLLGMQFFPLLKPGSSFTCTSESDCGAEGGPCFLNTCLNGDTITLCRSDADCVGEPGTNPCVPFGLCAGSDPASPTACVLPSTCGGGLGACEDLPERSCTNATSCEPASYATPAVEIGPVASVSAGIEQALLQKQPEGLTPTAPALQGALDHARLWSRSRPGESVAVVLATDGLPTQCATQPAGVPSGTGSQQAATATEALNQVLSIAASAAADVRTYVIGVFPPSDAASSNNTNAIAQAGGTDAAVLIDASGEVEQQFLEALRIVRRDASSCQIALPSSPPLDYARAELQFASGAGTATAVPYVESLFGCAARPEGWYYDTPPAQGQPSSIRLCPNLCQLVRSSSEVGLQLEIACAP